MRFFTQRRRAAILLLGSLAGAGTVLSACTDEADRAARERIFSPEDPSPDVLRAAETLDVSKASTDPAVWARLLRMDRLEATRRIGAHEATTKVEFEWTRGDKTVGLEEDYTFATDADGHFRTTITNDQDAGLEFVWADGRAFARSRYGPFRERRIDRAQHDVWRDRATGALREIFELYEGRLRSTPKGQGEHQGRKTQRFGFVLGDRWGPAPVAPNAPPRLFPKVLDASGQLVTGPDDDTARRIAFTERKVPREASGEFVIDEKTGVILQARLEGVFTVADSQPDGQSDATLSLSVAFDVDLEAEVKVEPPEKVVSTAIPHTLQDPLSFLGDAAPKPAAAEPPDEDE